MSFLATALGQDPTRIEQAPFTENRLQIIQRQNQDRLNRNEFLRGTKDARKQLAGLMVDPNLNPDLGNYFSNQRVIIPPTEPKPYDIFSDPYREDRFRDGSVTKKSDVVTGTVTTGPIQSVPNNVVPNVQLMPPNQQLDSGNTLDQIPEPVYTEDITKLVPDFKPDPNFPFVVTRPDVSNEDKRDLHVGGFPWKVITKPNGGSVVVHNGVEYNIVDAMGDGSSFVLQDKYGRMAPGNLTDAFTKGRAKGILDTTIGGDTDVGKAATTNTFVSNALSDIRAGKFDNDTTRRTIATAERLGIDVGDALALLAIESRFGNFNWKGKVGKGPLQIEKIAHTDMVRWYSNNNHKPAGMSASEWAALRQQMMTVKDFNLVKNDEQAAITAALLFFKQIQMLGVPPEFYGAAYNDGPYKYRNISSLSQVKKFAGKHTLQSVNKYNMAFLNMRGYLGNLGNAIRTGTSTAGLNVGGTTTANNQTATTSNQTVNTQSNVAQSANTGNNVVASQNLSSLEIINQEADKVEKPGTKKEEVVEEAKEPAFYQANPSNIGFELRQTMDTRQLLIDQANRRLLQMNGLAEVSLLAGNNEEYMRLNNLATTLKEATEIEAQKAENTIMYLQGMQGLQDLAMGNTARAAYVWSQYSGYDVRIIPRTDGKYDVTLNGKPYKTYTASGLSDTLRRSFDEGYRGLLAQVQAEQAKETFKTTLEIYKKKVEQAGEVMKEQIKAAAEMEKARIGTSITNIDGIPFVVKDGKTFAIEIETYKDVDGQNKQRYRLEPIDLPAGNTGNAYKRN